jgi:hypothetical protein
LEFSVHAGYLSKAEARTLYAAYNEILGVLVGMIVHSSSWILPRPLTK